jgi:hypoxanthine-guanine phosphoribosyltransferase
MLRQKGSMPEGHRWGDAFPAVVNHTSSGMARRHPDFHAAKHGDYEAALRLVDAFVKDSKIADIAQRYPHAHIVYNHKMQGGDINMIPAAYAAKFSAIGMTVDHNIIAVTDVSHTNATDLSRISKRMRFEGEVRQGMDYIILDDFITSGAELRDLRDYIQSRGGNVVLMTTFGHGSFGKLQDIRIDSKYIERLNASGITDQDLRKYGIASEIGCLTLGEAARLSRLVNARAKAEAARRSASVQRTSLEQLSLSGMAGEIPRGGVQGIENEKINETSKTINGGEQRAAKGLKR